MLAEVDKAPAPPQPATALQLVCSEVWGGNRMIDAPVDLPGLRGHIYSRPCDGGHGGDVHYLAVCGAGCQSRLWISDVVGHGEAVAKVSDEIHTLLRRYMNRPDQRRVLENLNVRLEQIGLGAMTTAAIASYHAVKQSLSISYAGHPPGWFYERATDRWTRLLLERPARKPGSLVNGPLAVDAGATFTRLQRNTAVGDRLLLLTDGVLEAPDADGNRYGAAPLETLLNDRRHDDPDQLIRAIVEHLTERAGSAGLNHDDITLLVVEVVPGPRRPIVWRAIKNLILRPYGNGDDPAFADPRKRTS